MQKIIQVIGTLDRGGVESMILNLIKGGLKTDICVEIPDKGALEDEIISYGCKVYHLTRRSTSMKQHHLEFAKIVKNYEIVHIHTQNAFLALCEVKTAHQTGVKNVIVHSHNTKDWRRGLLLHLLSRKKLLNECIPLACSTEAGNWMFGEGEARIIPLPIETEKFRFKQEVREIERKRQNLDNTVLLHIGNFRKAKNHIFLINMMRRMENKTPGKYTLLLAGDGLLRKKMEKKAKGLPIHFLGSINDIPEKMMAADVLVLPSKNEGLPTVLLEGQCDGIFCVASDKITREVKKTNLVVFRPLDTEFWRLELAKPTVTDELSRPFYADELEKTNGVQAVVQMLDGLYQELS